MDFKVLIGDKGYVDFDAPVRMSIEEKDKFLKLLRSIFSPLVIKERKVDRSRDWRIGDKILYPRPWIAEEYDVLLGSDSIEEIIGKLGRSWMAIIIQDGWWRPQLLAWCRQNGKNLLKGNRLEIIKEFLKSREDIKKGRREEKKAKKNQLKRLEAELLSFGDKRKIITLNINLGRMSKEQLEKLEKEEKELISEINKLKKELGVE